MNRRGIKGSLMLGLVLTGCADDGEGGEGRGSADCPTGAKLVASGELGVYMEVESVAPGDDWTEGDDGMFSGFFGESFYQWKDEKVNEPEAGDPSVMTYCFEVETSGTYKLGIHGRRDRDTEFCMDAANDACNDVFVRFDDAPWTKKMIKPAWGEWKWDENWDPQNGSPFPTEVDLQSGVHVLEVAGRSHGTKIDAIRVYEKDSVAPEG